ncbi:MULTISPECIES: cytochrome d ubiquinol oxidase subunit II [unclassified Adlercreutzia]|uniref:cytochrome d ubiquinol oxidase subunit II n=1 Tax=unclassified Adlercreutzia TaxID=2636013 RepID=UPI0013EC4D6D|nr:MULTISPECIES: cytochrome d ubiquinol oxidase subunit II [unclassified Adlercreutzia]
MSTLAILWYFLVFLLIAGYFVLDGFDLGAGVLYPFVAKDERDQAIVRRALGPVWDGNEVWLLTAGGALFAAFPDAYATTFSGFYLAIMLVLFALIVRAVSFEFWAADTKWRPVWNACFFLGSLLPALLFGVAVGNVVQGIPMDVAGNYTGVPLLGLITPFTLLCGLFGLAMFIAAGACWLALKAPLGSALEQKVARLRMPFQIIAFALFALLTIMIFVAMGGTNGMVAEFGIVRWLLVLLFVVCMIMSLVMGINRKEGSSLWVFIYQSIAAVASVFLVACSMFPVLVAASPESVGPAITLMSAGASDLSLFCMTVILCIGLPFVLVYHVIIYRTFRGRVKEEDVAAH